MTTAEKVEALIQTAKGEIGTHEENGPNDGTCAKYQAVTGNEAGDSWCLSFVCWCFKQIGLLTLLPRVTASCEEMRQAAIAKSLMVTWPRAGDVGFVVNTAQNHAHHCYIVEGDPATGTKIFPTIEGNSNTDGSSNGDGTYERDKRFVGGGGPINHYEFMRVFPNE